MKRKTLAILLSVLLVVSAVLVLTACSKEYTVTFRDAGLSKDVQTTVKGKVEYKGEALTADDKIFEGWYDAATGGNKIDLETAVFDKDTTLHAHWTMIGESKGYCLPGVINGVQYMGEEEKDMWDTKNAAEEPTRKLTHESATSNVYTIDLTLKATDSFKLITALGVSESWNKGKIQVGGKETTVKLADGVTLEEGLEIEDLFNLSNSDNNIMPQIDMTATLKFTYNGNSDNSTIEITVKSVTGQVLEAPNKVGFFVAGTFNGFYDKGTVPATGDVNSKYVMTADAANNLFTIEGLQIKQGESFKVKINETAWRTQYGYAAFTFDLAQDATVTGEAGGKTMADVFVQGVNDDSNKNVVVKYNVTVDMELDYSAGVVTLTVTAIDWTEQKPVQELGCLIVGDHNGWKLFDSPANLMPYDETSQTYKINGVQIGQDGNFAVKVNEAGWERGQFGRGCVRNVTFATSLTELPEGIDRENAIAVIGGDAGNAKANIVAKNAITINVTLDYEAGKVDIEITAIEARNEAAPQAGFSIAGTINGWASETPKIAMTANEEKTIFTKEGLALEAGSAFQIKNGENGNWNPQFGAAAVKSVTLAQGLELPADKTSVESLFDLTGDDIKAVVAMTITITLDWTTKEISIIVTEFPAAE